MSEDETPKIQLEPGDVVQLSPSTRFVCGFMVVDEVKEWGAKGYMLHFENINSHPKRIFYRAKWSEMAKIGKAVWSLY